MLTEPEIMWRPPEGRTSRLADFQRYVGRPGGYEQLWAWSVDDLEGFWGAVWRYFGIEADGSSESVLTGAMPTASWFPHVALNYAEHVLRALRIGDPHRPVVLAHSDTRASSTLSAADLVAEVARVQAGLRGLGVGPGDRVAAYLPNVPEAVVAFLATASLGAVWSSCAPEFGVRSVIDRLAQIEPSVLIAVDGYRYGPRLIDRGDHLAAIRDALPTLTATVWLPYLEGRDAPEGSIEWSTLGGPEATLTCDRVPFHHPLYVLYSSGTTGLPKAIVHGHGGILLEHMKMLALHHDLGTQDRFYWFTTTGWMMWNFLVSGLLTGAAIVLYDGDPSWPDLGATWRMAASDGVTMFGSSAPFLMNCRRAGLAPGQDNDLSALRSVGSTGSPLPADGYRWIHDAVGSDIWLTSISGGTDLCTTFVGGSPTVPVWEGEISCRCLGAAVESFDESGRARVGVEGELVLTQPMPSMPAGFWGDPDGNRYREAYFEPYPGIWRHGDWITITDRGSCVITGRSDATLNRGGVRLGTSELYSVVEDLDAVVDSLVVHLEDPAGPGSLLLFVVLADGYGLDEDLRATIKTELRTALSPRHVPDEIHAISAVPRTLSGKKLEVPVKRILTGTPADLAASAGSLVDPSALEPFAELARRRRPRPEG